MSRNFTETYTEIVESLQNKTLVVTTIMVIIKAVKYFLQEFFSGSSLSPTAWWDAAQRGLVGTMLSRVLPLILSPRLLRFWVSEMENNPIKRPDIFVLEFNFTLKWVDDGAYGFMNKETGEWNGLMGELLAQKADLAIADLTITYEREQAVDFSMPFMNLGISILYKKPQKKPPDLFSFLSPLSLDVWIYTATAYLGVSILLFILARYH